MDSITVDDEPQHSPTACIILPKQHKSGSEQYIFDWKCQVCQTACTSSNMALAMHTMQKQRGHGTSSIVPT